MILGIQEDCYDQDWEIEAAEPARIQEYIDLYERSANSSDEKFTLMALILGAFDQFYYLAGHSWEHWPNIRAILVRDIDVHRDHIKYYQCNDEELGENTFPVTKKMREIVL